MDLYSRFLQIRAYQSFRFPGRFSHVSSYFVKLPTNDLIDRTIISLLRYVVLKLATLSTT